MKELDTVTDLYSWNLFHWVCVIIISFIGWRWDKEDVTANTMKSIIQIHNVNNEMAWEEVIHWEKFMGYVHNNDRDKLN